MNLAIIMGHIGKDIDLRYTSSELAVARFSVATSENIKGEKKTTWHNVVAFGKTAENINKYFDKGRKILIEGKIDNSTYEKDGERRNISQIIVNKFHFIDSLHASKIEEKAGVEINDKTGKDDIPF